MTPNNQDTLLCLPAHCATVAAEELHGRLIAAVENADIRIDAGEVENIGQAVLQLLVAARREAVARGHGFAIANPSPAFAERVRACGLDEAVGLSLEGETIS